MYIYILIYNFPVILAPFCRFQSNELDLENGPPKVDILKIYFHIFQYILYIGLRPDKSLCILHPPDTFL